MNNFPIRCRLVRTMRGLGAEDALSKTLEKSGEDLQKGIIEAVIKQCGVSIGVSIGLMFVPVLGQAIAGLMSVMQMIMGKKYEKDTQEVIERTSQEIKARAERSQEEVKSVAVMVYQQELPAARVLAMSNQPLGDLGFSISRAISSVGHALSKAGSAFDDAVHKFGSEAASQFSKMEDKIKEQASKLEDQAKVLAKNPEAQLKFITTLSPVGLARLGIKYTLTATKAVAKGIESTNIIKEGTLTDPLSKARSEADKVMYDAQRLTSPLTTVQEGARQSALLTAEVMKATGNESGAEEARQVAGYARQMQTAVTPIGFYNLTSGRESYLAAKAECEKMRANAFAAIDKQKSEAIAQFMSEKGRSEMRKSTAKAMRQDPSFITYMGKIKALEDAERIEYEKLLAQEQAAMHIVAQNVQPSAKSGGTGAVVGLAAAVAAALALTR